MDREVREGAEGQRGRGQKEKDQCRNGAHGGGRLLLDPFECL